jgi:phenylalanyl-tRNA synthetase beta chain
MKVPLGWLRDYVTIDVPPENVERLFAMMGFVVDKVEQLEGDWVYTIDIPSNRPDCLSIIGLAREIAAATGQTLRTPAVQFPEQGPPIEEVVTVEVVDADLCPRYTARAILGIKVGPSPEGMQKRLRAIGMRPINNIVDVTNYVMAECGQPLHAFDLRTLQGPKIVIRQAKPGEKIVAIDGKVYEFPKNGLAIADAKDPVAIAGIMGGQLTEIKESTRHLVLESALFDPINIRLTSKALGLSSESSYRFERQADYQNVEWASKRATQLFVDLAGGQVAKGMTDVSFIEPETKEVILRLERIGKVLGVQISKDRVQRTLQRLGFTVDPQAGAKAFKVTVPHWRRDVKGEIDLIEDVARVEGYDGIPAEATLDVTVAKNEKFEKVRDRAKSLLTASGFYEVLTWSFTDGKIGEEFRFWVSGEAVTVKTPDGKIDRYMRRSILPGMLQVCATNQAFHEPVAPLFEISRVYSKEGTYHETLLLAGVDSSGFDRAKGALQLLANEMQVPLDFKRGDVPGLARGSSCIVSSGNRPLGYLGKPDPAFLQSISLDEANLGVFEIDFDAFTQLARLDRKIKPLARQVPVRRDLAFILDRSLEWAAIEACVKNASPANLEKVELFDVYQGKGVPEGKKSLAFSLIFRHPDRSLRGEEIESAVQTVVSKVTSTLGGVLRTA